VIAAEGRPVQVACRILGVSESGYYEQRVRAPSERAVRHAMLTDLITQIHTESYGTYGARRVYAELTLGRGVEVGHNQVELVMRRAGLQGVSGRRKWKRIRPDNIATDLVERSFNRDGPNQLWVTDITEHPTREGKVYCCVVLDTYSRRVVGWSGAFTQRAKDSGLLASMGSIGDCYNDSMIEAFWSRMQVELLDRNKWNTRIELANAMFEYLEIWHSRKRRHGQLGWLTPIQFEHNSTVA
jgi:transposase InsO family protein